MSLDYPKSVLSKARSEVRDTAGKYGKPAALAGSAGLAGFAAIDQALQGETYYLELLAENSELIDGLGHDALGVTGAIATEKAYSQYSENPEEGPGKYLAMVTGAFLAGGAGQACQYVIPGDPELYAALDAAEGAIYAVAAQAGADQNK
jgi:hypothetical protein